MRYHRKAIALIFVFLLIGHDCARIQDEHEIAGASRMREKNLYETVSVSQWWTHARQVCPMFSDVAAVQERYHKKMTKLFEDVRIMEDSEWTTTFLWKLHDIGLRLDGFGSCLAMAAKKPELLKTLTDSNVGLMPVLSKVVSRVMAQLRQRDILNRLETPTCKVRLEELIKQVFRNWEADSEAHAVKSTHTLIFGADCDVDSYMSSLGFGAASRKDLLDLDSSLIMMANSSLRRNAFETTESALKKAGDVLEKIPSESHAGDDADDDDDDDDAVSPKELDHDGQEPFPHKEFGGDGGDLLLQHNPEAAALLEGHVQKFPRAMAGTLDVLAYLGSILGMFVLIIAGLCVMVYGVGPVFKGITSIFGSNGGNDDHERVITGGSGKDTQDKDADFERRMMEAKMEQIMRKLDRINSESDRMTKTSSRRLTNSQRGRSKSSRARLYGRGSARPRR